MFNYSTLENISIENLHYAFVKAFADYQVNIDLPILKFQNMLHQRGYTSEYSIGAFKDDILVGFILNAIRPWNDKLTSYDTGTGVIKEYRNNGITSAMFQEAKELLKKLGVKQYLLEVIQTNTPAVNLYIKNGFNITREFDCYRILKGNYIDEGIYNVQHIKSIMENDIVLFEKFWDFIPSWQNSFDSINASSNLFEYSIVSIDNKIVGYGAVEKSTGNIPQLAVDCNYRGKGIGKSLLIDLIRNTESNNISFINVDSKCDSMSKFLLSLGFTQFIKQYEMILDI